MASAKRLCVFAIACLTAVSAFSISYTPHTRGRKLFGGYRIVPKVCQPTNPARIKSTEPAICMFNYECTRRNGEVVGACMDGFLFGACCQLPPKDSSSDAAPSIQPNSALGTENLLNLHEIDHVPDIPILLNPDGTPVGMSSSSSSDPSSTPKITFHSSSNDLSDSPGSYTKISTFNPDRSTLRPSSFSESQHHNDAMENAEKPQIQPDVSHLEADFPALLGQQEVLDDLRLPGLITHSDANNDIQENQETIGAVNPVTTLLSPDQILQIADPVDQLPALFAQGLGQNNHSGADTMLLNANGTYLNENNNPDELFRPGNVTGDKIHGKPQSTSHTTSGSSQHQGKPSTPMIQHYANTHRITGTTPGVRYTSATPPSTESRTPTKTTNNYPQSTAQKERDPSSKTTMLKIDSTTPMSSTFSGGDDDDFVRVPTITYDVQSGNKKNDELDREEIAINHIISILNATTPSSHTKYTQQMPLGSSSSIHTWTNVDEETSRPPTSRSPESRPTTTTRTTTTKTTTETFPYTFYKPGRPSTYYHYDSSPTPASGPGSSFATAASSSGSSNFYTSRTPAVTQGSYGSSAGYDYSTRPSTNPPAPTVIVLGPLGTEYTTVTTQKPASRRPTTVSSSIRPSIVTKQPSIGTTITHNISTVISTNGANVASNNHVVSSSFISVNLKDNTSPKPSDTVILQETVVSNADDDTKASSVVTKRPSTIWTTLSSWSDKPIFQLKPSKPDFHWPTEKPNQTLVFKKTTIAQRPATSTTTATVEKVTAASTICDEETPAPDDLINFPPVRNPNLTQQEKPTLVQTFNETDDALPQLNENEIPTPSFIEDDVLTNKVDVFVNKIVQSLQSNFQDLKDVVYTKKNVTASTTTSAISSSSPTKKPPTRKPAAKPTPTKTSQPTRKPPTKKPARPTQKPGSQTPAKPAKPTTLKPRPTSSVSPTTKRPQTAPSKRKPTRKPTTTTTTTTTTPAPEAVVEDVEEPVDESSDVSTEVEETTSHARGECGVRPLLKSGRIVGGKGASFGEWPWQVLVREATWLGLFTKNKCGGVLITNNYVITAAHCQPGFLATLVAVLGEFDLSGELESKRSVTRNVRRVIVNRGYNAATFENDLALLELEKPVQFDAHIVPICMPDDGADFTGRMATVTGWGRVKYNGGTPSVLQEVQVPIMENAVCQEMFRTAGHSKLILDSFLCAGYASGQKDSCEGDSGGPLMMEGPDGRWILVGTVSHGIKCAAPYLPGVYMRTTFFKPWLHSVTGV